MIIGGIIRAGAVLLRVVKQRIPHFALKLRQPLFARQSPGESVSQRVQPVIRRAIALGNFDKVLVCQDAHGLLNGGLGRVAHRTQQVGRSLAGEGGPHHDEQALQRAVEAAKHGGEGDQRGVCIGIARHLSQQVNVLHRGLFGGAHGGPGQHQRHRHRAQRICQTIHVRVRAGGQVGGLLEQGMRVGRFQRIQFKSRPRFRLEGLLVHQQHRQPVRTAFDKRAGCLLVQAAIHHDQRFMLHQRAGHRRDHPQGIFAVGNLCDLIGAPHMHKKLFQAGILDIEPQHPPRLLGIGSGQGGGQRGLADAGTAMKQYRLVFPQACIDLAQDRIPADQLRWNHYRKCCRLVCWRFMGEIVSHGSPLFRMQCEIYS